MLNSQDAAIFKWLNQWYNEILLKRFLGDMKPMLSKSRFLAGLQCPLRLWYQCYNREFATPASPSQQAIFDMGHEVGLLATKFYMDAAETLLHVTVTVIHFCFQWIHQLTHLAIQYFLLFFLFQQDCKFPQLVSKFHSSPAAG
jgi:hypothetical protein